MIEDNYADTHSHALYGIDDGARSIDESLKMLEIAHSEGVHYLYEHCPGDYVDALVHGNAHRMLAGKRVEL